MQEKNFADISYSKELKDEFPESEWWWIGHDTSPNDFDIIHKSKADTVPRTKTEWKVYPALTTDMLLEIFPYKVHIIKRKGWCRVHCRELNDEEVSENMPFFCDKSLPNTLSKCLIYLRNNKLLK